ncbi:beta-lactamase [Carbonactinospora thermoautotrophica]|uniref:Beta-lactamase n=1 Tax=Carbonactinospora thermoautotrophica TaxID=1469144 RepID=A0A132MWH6_9ACTN|nr:beta-lactamase [Carbonactinospora thermoautotrophica]
MPLLPTTERALLHRVATEQAERRLPSLAAAAVRDGEVALTNSTSGMTAVAWDLIDILAEHEPRLPEEWTPLPEVDPELLELAGPWYWRPAPYALRLLPDRWLRLEPLNGPRFRRTARGPAWTGTTRARPCGWCAARTAP